MVVGGGDLEVEGLASYVTASSQRPTSKRVSYVRAKPWRSGASKRAFNGNFNPCMYMILSSGMAL